MSEDGNTPLVLICDDDAAVRDALALVMQSADLQARTFSSGAELLDALPTPGPACLLLDLRMPGMSGMDVQQELKENGFDVPIIFLTAHGEIQVAVTAVQRGALGFLEKPAFRREELLEHVHKAIAHHRKLLARQEKESQLFALIDELSKRELEVARLAAAGKANKVIALELGISERTVEVHRSRAMKKLGLRSAAGLIRLENKLDRQMKLSL